MGHPLWDFRPGENVGRNRGTKGTTRNPLYPEQLV
jgi:hypothetical protein